VGQGMDYGEQADVQQVHAAVQREKREPRVGAEPLSIWLIAVYGLAVFFGGAYLGRSAGSDRSPARSGLEITTLCICEKVHALVVGLKNGSIELWDSNGQHITDVTGHKGPVECLALSPDGFTLASGGSEGTIVLWDLKAACGRKDSNRMRA